MILIYILIAVIIVSLISLIGLALISLNQRKLTKIIPLLVSFAAGSMIGAAFLHILPESSKQLPDLLPYLIVIGGIILFFVIEKVLHWRHCHEKNCKIHEVAYLNLFGDFIHNIMDGVAIASSFLINISTGIATTIAIAAHEIPQEIGDFSILIHSGFTRIKALIYNFLSALGAIIGALLTFLFANYIQNLVIYIMPIAAGGFIYMAASDLIPELHKENRLKESLLQFGFLLLGVAFMWIMKVFLETT